jgi:hypothetical protein
VLDDSSAPTSELNLTRGTRLTLNGVYVRYDSSIRIVGSSSARARKVL